MKFVGFWNKLSNKVKKILSAIGFGIVFVFLPWIIGTINFQDEAYPVCWFFGFCFLIGICLFIGLFCFLLKILWTWLELLK